MNTMFLRRYEVEPALAVTQGVLDGIAGFITQAGVLVIGLLLLFLERADMLVDADAGGDRERTDPICRAVLGADPVVRGLSDGL